MLIRSKIASTVTNISNVTGQPTLVNDAINIALDRVYQYHDWPYYMVESFLTTLSDYSVGTIAINNGSAMGTITTGVVSANWAGRKVRIGSEKTYYRISSVNTGANTITLETSYLGTSVTASGYDVYQDEYRLASDVDKYKTLRQMQNGVPIISLSPTQFDLVVPSPQNFADPTYEMNIGTTCKTYTTGTISTTGSTVTGVGTLWLTGVGVEGMGHMSLLRIGSNVYTIKSVDSDTQITTYEAIGSNGAGTSYEISLNNILLQLYYLPNATRMIRYRYFRMPKPLVNDYDIPDMPHEFHWLLIYGALSFIYLQKGDINKAQIEAENRFVQGLEAMKQKIGSFAPNRINRRKSMDTLRKRRFDAVEPSNFDWRYAA